MGLSMLVMASKPLQVRKLRQPISCQWTLARFAL